MSQSTTLICLHMEVALTEGASLRGKILDFFGLGGPGAAGKPLKKVGGFAHHLFQGFPGRPWPPRPQKSPGFSLLIWPPLLVPPPCEGTGPMTRSGRQRAKVAEASPATRSPTRGRPELPDAWVALGTGALTKITQFGGCQRGGLAEGGFGFG